MASRPRVGYEIVKESGVVGAPLCSAATVTTTCMTPIPVPRAAWRTMLPAGLVAAIGSLHVESGAHCAVIPVIVTLRAAETRSVQPFPLPRPSAIVTGTRTDSAAVAATGAARAANLPGTKVSFTTIVPAYAGAANPGAANAKAAQHKLTRRCITTFILRRAWYPGYSRSSCPRVPDPGKHVPPSASDPPPSVIMSFEGVE